MVVKGLFAPPSLGPTVKITAFTLTSFSTLVVLLRFYCRISVARKLKAYDYLIAAAVICTWGLCVINHFQIYYGTGSGAWPENLPPPPPEFIRDAKLGAAKVWYAYQIIYLLIPAFIKLSILVFYLSIATHRMFKVLVYASIAFVSTYSLVMILVNAFECPRKPSLIVAEDIFLMRQQWHCFDLRILYYSQAALNVFSDLFILFLPLPILIQLRMPTLKRICLLVVFSAGMLVPIAAAFRIWALYLWSDAPPDISRYSGGYILFWDQVELNTAIICASAPSLQPLFKRIFGELSRLTRGQYYYYGDGPTTMTQMTIGRRGSRRPEQDVALESPASTYRPQKQDVGDMEAGVIVLRQVDEEEEIKNRVRAFTARPPSAYSHPPKSPAEPRDILASG